MYIIAFAGLFGFGLWLLHTGFQIRQRGRVRLGVAVLASLVMLLVAMAFWAELLWFESLGFNRRFWTFVFARIAVSTALFALTFSLAWVILRDADVLLRRVTASLAAIVGAFAGLQIWSLALLYINKVDAGVQDPMLGMDVGFYLFTLPLLDALFWLLLSVAVMTLLAALLLREQKGKLQVALPLVDDRQSTHIIPRASLFLALVLAFGELLAVCHLLYSQLGVVLGPGGADIHVRLPALAFMGLLFIVAGALPLSARFRAYMHALAMRWMPRLSSTLVAVSGAWLALAALWLSLVVVVPQLVQWLVVKPNEITFELPYIARNIELTRKAFQLDTIEERQFDAEAALTRESMADNAHLLSEVRLWDWRALDAVYKQFQEIRLYYEFVDVDIDRYQIGDRYRQVMVSARELAQDNLSEQSQTFVNKRFKYTHGYGYTLAPVSDFTPEGLPNLLVKNIPPVTSAPELAVERPEIYYGELTTEPVVVNTSEPEFDYPSGEANMYTHYEGSGGVRLSSFWRKWLFGWKYDGTVFLLSSYPTSESRILYYRQVQERVRRVAPFLVFDEDPYIIAVDGRLKWIVDAYTSSSFYPYSQPFDSREYISLSEGQGSVGTRTVQAWWCNR